MLMMNDITGFKEDESGKIRSIEFENESIEFYQSPIDSRLLIAIIRNSFYSKYSSAFFKETSVSIEEIEYIVREHYSQDMKHGRPSYSLRCENLLRLFITYYNKCNEW